MRWWLVSILDQSGEIIHDAVSSAVEQVAQIARRFQRSSKDPYLPTFEPLMLFSVN